MPGGSSSGPPRPGPGSAFPPKARRLVRACVQDAAEGEEIRTLRIDPLAPRLLGRQVADRSQHHAAAVGAGSVSSSGPPRPPASPWPGRSPGGRVRKGSRASPRWTMPAAWAAASPSAADAPHSATRSAAQGRTEPRAQRLALEELGDHEDDAVRLADVVQGEHGGVVEGRHRASLALKRQRRRSGSPPPRPASLERDVAVHVWPCKPHPSRPRRGRPGGVGSQASTGETSRRAFVPSRRVARDTLQVALEQLDSWSRLILPTRCSATLPPLNTMRVGMAVIPYTVFSSTLSFPTRTRPAYWADHRLEVRRPWPSRARPLGPEVHEHRLSQPTSSAKLWTIEVSMCATCSVASPGPGPGLTLPITPVEAHVSARHSHGELAPPSQHFIAVGAFQRRNTAPRPRPTQRPVPSAACRSFAPRYDATVPAGPGRAHDRHRRTARRTIWVRPHGSLRRASEGSAPLCARPTSVGEAPAKPLGRWLLQGNPPGSVVSGPGTTMRSRRCRKIPHARHDVEPLLQRKRNTPRAADAPAAEAARSAARRGCGSTREQAREKKAKRSWLSP